MVARLLSTNAYFVVREVVSSAEYYRDVLGFEFNEFWGDPPMFVMVRRDGLQIMLRQGNTGTTAMPNQRFSSAAFNAYFYVDDVDALYAEFIQRGACTLYAPESQPHGCR